MKRVCCFFLLWGFSVLGWPASENGWFRRLSVEDGLPSNSVRAILQDCIGFVWIGTDYGLCRYDGTSIRRFALNPQGTDNYISSLYEADGLLYVGTEGGVYLYDCLKESFSPLAVKTEAGESIHSNVNHIAQDRDGNLWFTTVGQGIFCYHAARQQVSHYPFSELDGMMACTLIDRDNQVWAVSNWHDPALYKLNKAGNRFEPFKLSFEGRPFSYNALAMIEDSDNNLWMGTWESGLHKVDRHTGKAAVYLHPSEGKGTMHIHSMTEYSPHELLIGSDDGLLLFDTRTGSHRLFTEDEARPGSLSNRFVYPVMKDREGGVWVGTFYGGLNYSPPYAGQFEGYAHTRFASSVNGTVISHFCEDGKGRIWIASDDGGLSCYLPAEQRFLPLPRQLETFSHRNLHALCMDGDDLWVGTYTDGVSVIDTRTWQHRTYTYLASDTTTLDGSSSYAIYRDSKARIWVATMSGINLYDREHDCFHRIRDLDALTIDIDEDRKGNLWFSTTGRGLFRYHPDTGSWKRYSQSADAVGNNEVNCLHTDGSGTMWIGTRDGLCRYEPSTDSFKQVPLDLSDCYICGIVEEQGLLWLTTSRGLVCYDPRKAVLRIFTSSDGLLSEQFLPNAVMKATDGKIYAGSVNGFNAFHPYQLRENKVPPVVAITGVECFNTPVPIGDKRMKESLVGDKASQTSTVELWPDDSMFSLSFASLSYCSPKKNRYAYMLEGFDKDWNHVGSQNEATYTNLPAGKYLFRVKATNNDGLWSEQEARLHLVIHPPFYQTIGFKLMLLLLFVVSLFFFIQYLLKRAKKEHAQEIDQLNVAKEKEMHEAKIQFFTMIAHEIRTPVSLIIAPLEKIMKQAAGLPPAFGNNLEMIDRNSQRLLFLVNQLLDFRKVEGGGLTVRFAKQNICRLMRAVAERFTPFIEQNGAHLEVDYPDADFTATVDSEAVTKLISNLLTNASKYTRDSVRLSCHPNGVSFTLTVTDNGMGISPEEQQKIFRPFYQATDNKPGTGIGLSIVKSIVDLHHGHISVESEVGSGTSFIVTLPVEQADAVNGEEESSSDRLPEDILPENAQSASVSSKPMMLIVDDNEEMQHFLADCFVERYDILTAGDGVEAVERLRAYDVSLVVCDWMMPRMDGVELCKAVRADQTLCHIPFILLTARTDMNSKIEGMDCGADAYIEKPFSVRYLEACIKNLLDMRGLLRQKFSQQPMVPLSSIAANPLDSQFLTRINEVIEENFSNPDLTVDFLAEHLCISRSGLFAKIRTLADVTPNELIQIVRLKKAAALIKEGGYRINEICYMVGFSSPSYFSKCFQKQFGIKPKDFQNGAEPQP